MAEKYWGGTEFKFEIPFGNTAHKDNRHECVSHIDVLIVEASCDCRTAIEFGAFKELMDRKIKDGINWKGRGGDGSFYKYLIDTHVPKYGYANFSNGYLELYGTACSSLRDGQPHSVRALYDCEES